MDDIKEHVIAKKGVSEWTSDDFARNTADYAHNLTSGRTEAASTDVMSHGFDPLLPYKMHTENKLWPETPLTRLIKERGMTVYDYHKKWINNDRIICSGINFRIKHSFEKDVNELIRIAINEIHPNATRIRRAYTESLEVARMCWAATIKENFEIMFFFDYGRENITAEGEILYLIMTQVEIHGISFDEILKKYVEANKSKNLNLNDLSNERRFCQDLFYQAKKEMLLLKREAPKKKQEDAAVKKTEQQLQ